MLFNRTVLHLPLWSVVTTQEIPTTPFNLPIICSTYLCFMVQSYYSLLLSLSMLCKSFSLLSYTFSYFSHFISLPLFSLSSPSLSLLVFLSLQPLTAPTASLCNAASTLLPSLLAFSCLSHNLLAAHSRRLTPLFIDWGTGARGGAVNGVWEEAEQYFHKGYLRPSPLSSSSTIPGRHTVGS